MSDSFGMCQLLCSCAITVQHCVLVDWCVYFPMVTSDHYYHTARILACCAGGSSSMAAARTAAGGVHDLCLIHYLGRTVACPYGVAVTNRIVAIVFVSYVTTAPLGLPLLVALLHIRCKGFLLALVAAIPRHHD